MSLRFLSPQCPQNDVDVGYLLRLPKKYGSHKEKVQDEFHCLNLNVSVPVTDSDKLLPVLIWIHGRPIYRGLGVG